MKHVKEKSPYPTVKARFTYNEKEVEATVINPGACGGRAWMVFVDNTAWPDYFVVEAESPTKAEDVFVDSEFGKDTHYTDDDMRDYGYGVDDVNWSGSGIPYESEGIMVNGAEDEQIPWLCKYFAHGLPDDGIAPTDLVKYEVEQCESCGTPCYALCDRDDCAVCGKACAEELEKLFRW